MNTTENNKIIVEFMKWDILNDMTYSKATKGKWVELDKLKFHSDWNWLMEVVEKIESLSKENETYSFSITKISVRVLYKGSRIVDLPIDTTKIQAVYLACVEFIKWYNKNAVKS